MTPNAPDSNEMIIVFTAITMVATVNVALNSLLKDMFYDLIVGVIYQAVLQGVKAVNIILLIIVARKKIIILESVKLN
ncbi:MAG: hypothetical protein OXF77_00055 [Thaumarchaeota archaeon]|nr:hypothetical protein [Nitrososphaerota archaeon]